MDGAIPDLVRPTNHTTVSAALYELIRTGELAPGEKVDQRAVSTQLAVSRTPLREALRGLAADGMLAHTPNQGYVVAKLSAHDLMQYYALRKYLESELLRTMVWPNEVEMERLRAAELACVAASQTANASEAARCNRDFHFVMFEWSPMAVLRSEEERVWRVSEAYRILYLADTSRHADLLHDHAEMVEAVTRRDVEVLLDVMDRHRGRTQEGLSSLSAPNGSIRPILR